MGKITYFTTEQIKGMYCELNKDEKIGVLSSAIDFMEQYSGRGKFKCIAMAMGFDNDEGDSVSWYKRK